MTSMFDSSLWAYLPPIIAIVLALITKEAYSSLFIGILAGGLMYANFNPVTAIDSIMNDGLITAVSDTAGIFIFLVVLGIMVAIINKAGGSAAFGKWAKVHVKTKVGACLATFVLGILIFIDDYFNCLTVGSVMRPVTDANKVSRVKLAYLIDATAAPICMIAPISSWAAAVSEYFEGSDGLKYFIKAIPYNFYSLLTLVFIIAISIMGFDYGKMSGFEIKANNGDVVGNSSFEKSDDEAVENGKARVIDLILPVVILIICCVLALIYVGGFFDPESANFHNIITSFSDTDSTVGLPLGSIVALVVIMVYTMLRGTVSFKKCMECIPQGFNAMVPPILILTLATSLKNMTNLMNGSEAIKVLLANADTLKMFLPAIVFVLACIIAFATGTSWGTFGILIPIVQDAIGFESELGLIAMSACLAGAVCGDHCSPISDTTIMSSAGAQCNHVDHVQTQLPYSITVAAVSFVTYIVAGLAQTVYVALPVGIVLTVATLFVIKAMQKKAN